MGRHPHSTLRPRPRLVRGRLRLLPLGDLISSPLFYVTFGIVGGVAVVQRFENAALLLSAFPIVGLTLLSKTDFGANLERNILDRRPALEAIARETERAREAARERSPFYGAGDLSSRTRRRRISTEPSPAITDSTLSV